MRNNLEKVLDRGEQLGELEDKSELLVQVSARRHHSHRPSISTLSRLEPSQHSSKCARFTYSYASVALVLRSHVSPCHVTSQGAARFKSTSRELKRVMWWKNARWYIITLIIVLIIIIIVVVVEVEKNKKDGGNNSGPSTQATTTAPP